MPRGPTWPWGPAASRCCSAASAGICDEALVLRVGGGRALALARRRRDARAARRSWWIPDRRPTCGSRRWTTCTCSPCRDRRARRCWRRSRARTSLACPFLGHRRVTLGPHDVLLSRSGFTGELGFELFCRADDAVPLWRLLLSAGAPAGVLPYGYRCVDLLRIEAGFTLYPSDLGGVSSLWEAGLGWLVRDKVGEYVGHDAVAKARANGAATHRFAGVRLDGDVGVARGAPVRRGERTIGVMTSSAASPSSGETLCIAHVERDAVGTDAPVEWESWERASRQAGSSFCRFARVAAGTGPRDGSSVARAALLRSRGPAALRLGASGSAVCSAAPSAWSSAIPSATRRSVRIAACARSRRPSRRQASRRCASTTTAPATPRATIAIPIA